ncbi:hypothetical protein FNV58_00870 (plasmid) [Streptomyces sp. RLB1-9]|uniref:hypothetical protein n=1 Tax=Streptomyces sp. RLB1-9 TaxID=2594454 RepID=UPI00116548E8|nr:hypothetical protein [Streptomyces sp. RLB1-9]QDN94912.1 hypothetical protein FNV58_00870 [Streptomyces sp. RLB1-9]
MRRVGLLLGAVAVVLAASGCSSGSGDDKGSSAPYGAQSCSDWAGDLSDSQRWDAAKELLTNAKGTDGTEGDRAPATSTIKDFEAGLSSACDQGRSDDLLATVADDLYSSDRALYSY